MGHLQVKLALLGKTDRGVGVIGRLITPIDSGATGLLSRKTK
jgi:hypothetical protein